MVYEEFSFYIDKMIEQLKELLSPTWNIEVLVVHRTFHDWLLSVPNQIHKLVCTTDYETWTKRVTPFDLDKHSVDHVSAICGTHSAALLALVVARIPALEMVTRKARIPAVEMAMRKNLDIDFIVASLLRLDYNREERNRPLCSFGKSMISIYFVKQGPFAYCQRVG